MSPLKDPPDYVALPPWLIYGPVEMDGALYQALLQVWGWTWVTRRNGGALGTSVVELATRWRIGERAVYDRLQRFRDEGYLDVELKSGRVLIRPGEGPGKGRPTGAGSLLGEEPADNAGAREPGQAPAGTGQTSEEAEGSVQQHRAGMLWGQVLGELQLSMARATFDTWLAGSYVEDEGAEVWVVVVRQGYAVDWLENRLRGQVERVARRVAGREVGIVFVNRRIMSDDPAVHGR